MQMEREQGMMRGANEVCLFPANHPKDEALLGFGLIDDG